MNSELISVIVPVYNVEKYLYRCLDSLINQSYLNLEILLVNDGSTDCSGDICEEYAQKDSRITVVHKKNAGLGMARNSGLDISTGKYVIFVDSDDYLVTNMIENLYKKLKETNSDTCIGGYQRVYSDHVDTFENPFSNQVFEKETILSEVLAKMFGHFNNSDYLEMSVWKVLFSNRIIQEYELRFPSEREFISEDIIFDTEYYAKSTRVAMSNDIGYCYCDNEDSLTTRYNSNRFNLQVKLYEELVKRTTALEIYDVAKLRMDATLIGIARYSIKLEQKFSKKNTLPVAKQKIRNICTNSVLQQALKEFDSSKISVQSRIVNWFVKNKMVNSLLVIMFLKNKLSI